MLPGAPEYRLRSRTVPHVVRVRSPWLPQQHASDTVVQSHPHAPATDRRYVWSHARIAVSGVLRPCLARASLHPTPSFRGRGAVATLARLTIRGRSGLRHDCGTALAQGALSLHVANGQRTGNPLLAVQLVAQAGARRVPI